MENFASRLKFLRKERGLRQADLAQAIGVGQTTVANYEQNIRFPDEKTLLAIADFFSVSLDYLLGRARMTQREGAGSEFSENGANAGRPMSLLSVDYLAHLLDGNRNTAFALVEEAAAGGMGVRSVYADVLEPALKELGLLWEAGEIDVAEEHYVSESTEVLMARLHRLIKPCRKTRGMVICMSVSGERHRIGMKMVSDILEEEGWSTRYIGVNIPTGALIKTLQETKADILAISATMEINVDAVANTLFRVRSSLTGKPLKIVAGGPAFGMKPDLWKQVGADGYAADLCGAVELVDKLWGRSKSPGLDPGG